MAESVLILGANGRFGNAVAGAFADAGWEVLAQVRRPLQQPARAGIRAVDAALEDVQALARAARGAAVVVHGLNPTYTRWSTDALPLAQTAMDLAQQIDATLLFPGNVYNFGTPMPAVLAEDTPQHPTARKGATRVQIEDAMRARSRDGLRSVVIRAGDFFGAGQGSWFDLVIAKDLARAKITWPGPLDRMHAWAYLPDLARACVAVAEARTRLQAFEVLHFAGHALTGSEFVAALTRAARRAGLISADAPVSLHALPWALMRVASPFVPMWRELAEMRYLWTDAHRLSGERLASIVGTPAHTLIDAALDTCLARLAPGHGAPRRAPASTA